MAGRKPTVAQQLEDCKAEKALLQKRVQELELELHGDIPRSLPEPPQELQALVQRNVELQETLKDAECYLGGVQVITGIVRNKLAQYTDEVENKIRMPWKEWVNLLNDVWRQVVTARKVCDQKDTNIRVNPIISGILGLIGFNLNPKV